MNTLCVAKRQVVTIGLWLTMFVALVVSASAQCNVLTDTWKAKCTDTKYQCAAVAMQTCRIHVSESGGQVVLTQKDNPSGAEVDAQHVCVAFGTIIEWDEDRDNSRYIVAFSKPGTLSSYLFQDKTLVLSGSKTSGTSVPDSAEVAHDPIPRECNKYTIYHRVSGSNQISSDPKVIVNGGGGGGGDGGPKKEKKK